ncbi:hypothetical protein Tco_1286856 [Tanacetum coccineum]
MKHWEELIHENVFRLRGHRDHLSASIAHMLYCIVAEEQYNLAYFFVKRIECARGTPNANLPYGMFLTHLFRYVMEHYPHLDNGIYNVVDRVMCQLALKQTRKPRNDEEDDDDSRASTPSPTAYLNSLSPLNYENTIFPLLLNKMMIFSLSDKLPCLIKLNKSMKKLEVDLNHSARHCEESSEIKRNEDVKW